MSTNHLGIISKRQKIDVVLDDPRVAPKTKDKLRFIKKVRAFGIARLGLKKNKSYTYYTDIGRDHVAYNVVAVKPLSFQSYTWYFPFVGRNGIQTIQPDLNV